jgi:hypothetical protein
LYIFGGFTSIDWDSLGGFGSDPSANAFLFSLMNQNNQSCKIRLSNTQYSIYCHTGYGPTFGAGHDIHIANNANITAGSY